MIHESTKIHESKDRFITLINFILNTVKIMQNWVYKKDIPSYKFCGLHITENYNKFTSNMIR